MRILYLTAGHDVHDQRFAEAIRGAGHDCAIWVAPAVGAMPEVERLGEIRRAIRAVDADIVHAGPIQDVARLAAECGARPLVTASWGFDLLTPGMSSARLDQTAWTLERSDLLLVDCLSAAKAANEICCPSLPVLVLPWGVDLDSFRPGRTSDAMRVREQLGWSDATVVVTARSHEPRYGVVVAVEGFLRAVEVVPSLRLLVIGDGTVRPQVERLVAAAGAMDHVHFVGRQPPDLLPTWFAASDIYLSASRVDGSSVTLLEAMASGLPSVVSDIPGNLEWIDRESGRPFRDGDSGSLARALIEFASFDSGRLAGIGMMARGVVEQRADWRANVLRLVGAYESMQNLPRGGL